ncbi:PREDICTED: UDP-glucuronosyltransferase 2B17-like [Ceratosolen solmsi marchali]|uniref:UDP-glucuronosyltransferase n=1 Tax=Ceratosolen solmsi marchali TaxID=326594 RepID=A0AAJ6VNJ7_9HYME|nr:PREDICTED: UDP-glucuronosyltransferase 2B17-like [Ceratosolen solmsi marchali]
MTPSLVTAASCAFLALCLCLDASYALRILGLFPLHGKSHFLMCEGLMRNLAKRGHQVDVYSHFPLREPVANYTDYDLGGRIGILSNNVSYGSFDSRTNFAFMPLLMRLYGMPICELMDLPVFQKLMRDPPNDPAYDIVVIELFVAHCYLAWGHRLQVPVVTIITSTMYDWMNYPIGNPSNAAIEPSAFSSFNSPMTFPERLQNVLIKMYIVWTFDNYMSKQDKKVKELFGPDYPDIRDMQQDISLVLLNYHHSITGVRTFATSVQPVAGLHIEDTKDKLPKEVQKFLDQSSHGFIYFSFGSMMRIETFPKHVLEMFYTTFEKIAPVRVLIKVAKPEELPPGLPSNVLTQPWLSQIKVLQHKNIKAFITHGGLLGTQESIYYGVPMIGIPLFADQYFNIQSYAIKNIAVKIDIESITEECLTKAVMEVLHNPIYKQTVDKIGRIFKDDLVKPVDKASFLIEYVVRHGKDTLKSPILALSWWQRILLDVYGFIALIILITLYVIWLGLKMLSKAVWKIITAHSFSKLKEN